MISLENVGIAVRGRTIVERFTATLEPGTITHLEGKNGSGKTSLIRAIAGIQRHSGRIRFDGAQISRVRPALYVCFDDAAVFPFLTGYENIGMLLGTTIPKHTIAAAAPAIADSTLLRMPARKLSHGERKRLHLVAALLSRARYLVLDEALNGVDTPSASEVAVALRRHLPDATVLVTGHHDDACTGIASQHLLLENGALVRGAAP